MKLVIHIFTLYMFALALVPCGDGGGGIMELLKHISGDEHGRFSDHDQHSDNCGDDACSPFCVCSCCSTIINATEKLPLQIVALPPIPSSIPSFLPNINPSSFFADIWQPPRLS